jgi:hypothetical protein
MRQHAPLAALLAVFALVALGSVAAHGEVFVLKSGGRIEGEHLNRQRQPGQPYHVRTEEGLRLSLADSVVHRVVIKSDVQKQYEAQLPGLPNTVAGHWGLAEWCKEAGLVDERRKHLAAVIALEPDHADARKALGYQRFGSRWLTQEERLQNQGYVRYKGSWRLKQEVEIDSREREQELAVKQWRKNIRLWFDQVADGSRHADAATRELSSIEDPNAAPALAEILADADRPLSVRIACLDILAKLPPGLITPTLINLAMGDADGSLRDRCIDEIKRAGTHVALPRFLAELKSKDNQRVNLAGEALQRLDDKVATLPLIDALVTEHKYMVSQGGPPGSLSPSFGGQVGGSGSGQGGGLGGFGVGGKPKVEKRQHQNPGVLGALTSLHSGTNFQYDVEAWKKWYIQSHTSTVVDLRREE